ncbi:hydrogenase formation protein HypD [Aphanothece sacrum]|uniref:Hydrogenase expression/formation protein HypD n=1 Tax=Aphanothece sacrum FPU1 TaxID=1920663 RepID=A0A401ICH3_APHSA|nr:hydrogenase formation protein HypD [Aphanothece sacrum]GBF78942.1 hydrogenase expression/formation protein HypD [Aphanothece sacrum FPU1]GBF86710.1 hydrogenase expression/formation protein HypD [Aphanothece sacrum FPU3]
MKFVDEYRDGNLAQQYAQKIAQITSQPWKIMEICGGQTHSIVKYGIDALLPKEITLIHGPGCPVCVTPIELIDSALKIASLPNVIFCSFGDMLRVPGSEKDLLTIKAAGGDIRIVYSPLDSLKIAQENPNKQVVFFAVGFETTAPATAMTVYQASQVNLDNFTLLVSHVLVPPAMEAILSAPNCQVQGFLAAGHVCTVMGYSDYEPLAQKYSVPLIVTGFEPIDILQGIYLCLQQLESGQTTCENQYIRSVQPQGNILAQQLIQDIFEIVPRTWRGIGEIERSGLGLAPKYAKYDAIERFKEELAPMAPSSVPEICISGEIMQGYKKPHDCPAFGGECTPEHPLGAPMVSSEGACAAYYRYRHYEVGV